MAEERCYDAKGVMICEGDLVRTEHFIAKRKRHYLYHVVIDLAGELLMVPLSAIIPTSNQKSISVPSLIAAVGVASLRQISVGCRLPQSVVLSGRVDPENRKRISNHEAKVAK